VIDEQFYSTIESTFFFPSVPPLFMSFFSASPSIMLLLFLSDGTPAKIELAWKALHRNSRTMTGFTVAQLRAKWKNVYQKCKVLICSRFLCAVQCLTTCCFDCRCCSIPPTNSQATVLRTLGKHVRHPSSRYVRAGPPRSFLTLPLLL